MGAPSGRAGPVFEVRCDPYAAARRAAVLLAAAVGRARHRRAAGGRSGVVLALSGGDTGAALARALRFVALGWDDVEVVQVDERAAPAGSADRNAAALLRELVEPLGLHRERVHLMDPEGDLDRGAERYAALVQHLGGVDVVHLGLGADGHCASWPPGQVPDTSAPVAVTGPFGGWQRLTLTPAALARSDAVWLVMGESKRAALRSLLCGTAEMPARAAPLARSVVVADRAAWPASARHPR